MQTDLKQKLSAVANTFFVFKKDRKSLRRNNKLEFSTNPQR